jgi:hypothetical protein
MKGADVFNGHSPTGTSVRSGATAMQRPWLFSKANGLIPVWESLTLSGILSVRLLPLLMVPLETGGLTLHYIITYLFAGGSGSYRTVLPRARARKASLDF